VDEWGHRYSLSVLVNRFLFFIFFHDRISREHLKPMMEGEPFGRDQPGVPSAGEPGDSAQGGQQGWGGFATEVGPHRREDELEGRSALKRTGADHSP